jgi:endoglucanase Acf2
MLCRMSWSAALMSLVVATRAGGQPVVNAGSATYYGQTPAGGEVPSTAAGVAVVPNVVAGFSQPPQANKWWSSLIWQRYADNAFGFSMYPHPLAVRAYSNGLDIGYVRAPGVYGEGYGYDLNPPTTGLRIGVTGLSSPKASVERYGDWTVTAAWSGAGRTLKATFGHGLPFVYATVAGGDAFVNFNQVPGVTNVWADRGNVLGVTIGPSSYAIFGPAGSDWTVSATGATSNLAGRGYFSVAALPAATNAALDLFSQHAFAFVTDSRVSWQYDAANSKVAATVRLV